MSFSCHVDMICSKIASQIFLLRMLHMKCSNRPLLIECFKKFILPHNNHAAPVWADLSVGDSEKLEKLQRRAIRILLNYPYRQPISISDYTEVGLFPLQARRNVALACWRFKLLNGLLPRELSPFRPIIPTGQHPTRHPRISIPNSPRITSRFLDKSPLIFASKLLNSTY